MVINHICGMHRIVSNFADIDVAVLHTDSYISTLWKGFSHRGHKLRQCPGGWGCFKTVFHFVILQIDCVCGNVLLSFPPTREFCSGKQYFFYTPVGIIGVLWSHYEPKETITLPSHICYGSKAQFPPYGKQRIVSPLPYKTNSLCLYI